MSRWIVEEEIDRLDLGDKEWIDIKSKMTIADQDLLAQRLVEVESIESNREERRLAKRTGNTSKILKTKFRPSTAVLLEIAIVDWNLVNKAGEKIPLTTENIGRLDPSLAGWLEDKIEDRNPISRTPKGLT
jgi:hypothetical protein